MELYVRRFRPLHDGFYSSEDEERTTILTCTFVGDEVYDREIVYSAIAPEEGEKALIAGYVIVDDVNNATTSSSEYMASRNLEANSYDPAENDANQTEQMYVAIDDTFGTYAGIRYGDNEGEALSGIQVEQWQRWDIPFTYFSDGNFAAVPNDVDLSSIANVYIGFGNRRSPVAAGKGLVYFDDLRLSMPICRPEYGPTGDLSGNCVVDLADIGQMALGWLETEHAQESPADLYDKEPPGEQAINFRDYAELAGHWLEERLWPE
ncbi:MAG: hypothetical protein ACYTBJ_09080 [Planctomycetota bacterium]